MENDKAKFKNEFKSRLYKLILKLIKFIDKLPKDTTSGIIGRQLVRSGTSILANYIEGQSASSKKDFTNFFHHSLKSANESKVWVALLRDTDKADKKEADEMLKELDEISKIFASSLLTLKGKK
jgi:four helix bundle protein